EMNPVEHPALIEVVAVREEVEGSAEDRAFAPEPAALDVSRHLRLVARIGEKAFRFAFDSQAEGDAQAWSAVRNVGVGICDADRQAASDRLVEADPVHC